MVRSTSGLLKIGGKIKENLSYRKIANAIQRSSGDDTSLPGTVLHFRSIPMKKQLRERSFFAFESVGQM